MGGHISASHLHVLGFVLFGCVVVFFLGGWGEGAVNIKAMFCESPDQIPSQEWQESSRAPFPLTDKVNHPVRASTQKSTLFSYGALSCSPQAEQS